MKTPKSSIKLKSVQKSAKKMMENKIVLYVVAILAFVNVLGYLAKQNIQAVMFFLLVGFLTTYFSKNMIVVLLTAIVATNLLMITRFSGVKEGMTSDESKDDSSDDDESDKTHEDTEKQPVGVAQSSQAKKTKASYKKAKYDATKDDTTEGLAMPASEAEEEGSEEYASVGGGDNHIDYSKTLESAYGNLEKILGEGGMKDISKTTQQLMEQQKMLMDNMNQMQPMMKAAEGFLDKVGGGPLSKLLGGALTK